MNNIQFGDINIIISLARQKPHLEYAGHLCDCCYCRVDNEDARRCSECGHKEEDIAKFKKKGEDRICPKCKEKLMEESEYERYIKCKEQAYVLPFKKSPGPTKAN